MTRRLALFSMLALVVGCNRSKPRGDIKLSPVQVFSDGPGEGHVHVEFELLKTPPGDANNLYVQIGASMFPGTIVTVQWKELLERNTTGATSPTSTPQPGQRFAVDVPVKLLQQVKLGKHSAGNFDVITNVFWGSNELGPVQQARDAATLEHLYKHTM